MEELLHKFAAGLSGLGVGGYAVWRLLKRDSKSDGLDKKAQALIDNMEMQLKREIDEKHKISSVVDRLANERNDAVQKLGRLEGTVDSLKNEVGRMTEELKVFECRNQELNDTVMRMAQLITNLSGQLSEMQTRNNEFIDELRLSQVQRKEA